jgi:hypothetical protein
VQIEQHPVAFQRGAFELGCFAALDPQPTGVNDHDTLTIGCVNPRRHIHANAGVVGISVPLELKRLDVPVAVLIGVIDNPGLLDLARHSHLPPCRNMCEHIVT